MIPEFINEYEITFDIYKEWVKKPMGKKAKRNNFKRMAWKFGGLLISVFLILLGVLMPDNAALYIGIAFSGAMLYMILIYPTAAAKKQYSLAIESNNGKPWIRRFTFADVIQMSDFRTNAQFKYSQIAQVYEDERYYYLWLNSDFVLRLLKSAFSKGSAKAFKGYIDSKMKRTKQQKKNR